MAVKLKDLKVAIGLDGKSLNKLSKDLRSVQGKFRNNLGPIQKMVANTGRTLSIGITAPLGVMAAQSVKAFDQQAKAIAQVEAGLQSTAGQVGYTSEQLQRMASDLQAKTLFGDEVILKDATAQLLTFTNIAGDNFARTQQVALDLATRLDGDLKSASIQLGKALNDPISNLTALSRAGIQFSADQKEVIKSLTESGRLAEAQTIILDELEKQYGGSAEAAAQAGMGPFKQLQNTIGDLSEEFGKLINDLLKPLVPRIQALVRGFTDLTDRQKQVAMTAAAIAAAAGPIALLVSGMIKARIAMAALNVVMAANPLGAVVAGVTLLVGAMATLKASVKTTREETENFIVRTKELDKEQQILALNTKRRALETELAQLKQAKAAEEAASQVGALGDKFDKQIARGNVSKFATQIGDTEEAIVALKKATAEAQFGEGAVVGLTALPTMDATEAAPTAPTSEQTQAVAAMTEATQKQATAIENVKLASQDVLQPMLNMQEAVAGEQALKNAQEYNERLAAINDTALQLAHTVGDQLGYAFEQMVTGAEKGKEALKNFASSAIDSALAASQGHIIEAMIQSGKFTGPAAPFVIPALVASGLALVKGAFSNIIGLAEGGLAEGPTLAMVGEGPGTSMSNPEVIAPLDKLKDMMGGGKVQVSGLIRGTDILLSNERALLDRNRVRGF